MSDDQVDRIEKAFIIGGPEKGRAVTRDVLAYERGAAREREAREWVAKQPQIRLKLERLTLSEATRFLGSTGERRVAVALGDGHTLAFLEGGDFFGGVELGEEYDLWIVEPG